MNIDEEIFNKFHEYCEKYPCHKSWLVTDLINIYLKLNEGNTDLLERKNPNEKEEKTSYKLRINDKDMEKLKLIADAKSVKRTDLIRTIINDYVRAFDKRYSKDVKRCMNCNNVLVGYKSCLNCFEKI